ncbi:MAG TPA: hypothetical protein VFA33_18385 [Bryobacteraceae bacterium]|nr:hypothetical protein [Bryobacteraceae bacterium]
MSNVWKLVFAVAGVSLLAAMLTAQDAKKAPAHRGGILHPELTVETGTWDAPAAKLGEKTDQPWSATTVAAGVAGKPQPGRSVTRVGEIVDFSCYLQLGKHGEKHRACGQKCVNNGQPIGLLTKEGMLYMIMPEEHDPRRDGGVDARPSASDHMGHIVEVTGTETSVNGYRAIYVAGLKK